MMSWHLFLVYYATGIVANYLKSLYLYQFLYNDSPKALSTNNH